MVLSTIHTNDSVSAVTRLLDLGVPGFLLSATLRGVLSQRLMPVSCAVCGGEGCVQCGETGRAGRQVVSELLEVGPALAQAITDEASFAELERVAEGEGFCAMGGLADARKMALLR